MRPLRLGLLQYPVERPAGLPAFAKKLDGWLAEGRAGGAELLVLPEYACVELGASLSRAGSGGATEAAELAAMVEAADDILEVMRAAAIRAGAWLLPGTLRPDEIAEITGVRLPESGAYETVAGLLLAELGRMAEANDSVEVPATMAASAMLGIPEGLVGRTDDRRIEPETADERPARRRTCPQQRVGAACRERDQRRQP